MTYRITLTDPTGLHTTSETRRRADHTEKRAYKLMYDYLASWALLDTRAGWNAVNAFAVPCDIALPYGAQLTIATE